MRLYPLEAAAEYGRYVLVGYINNHAAPIFPEDSVISLIFSFTKKYRRMRPFIINI